MKPLNAARVSRPDAANESASFKENGDRSRALFLSSSGPIPFSFPGHLIWLTEMGSRCPRSGLTSGYPLVAVANQQFRLLAEQRFLLNHTAIQVEVPGDERATAQIDIGFPLIAQLAAHGD